ncbi:MAG: type III-B CRISPR module RAMP protein Cmr6 [Fibrobacter sp.]|nr:type III-B CRISPR module RAMP protein Cmr6 [Fibrobacter sp.]
MAIDAIRTYHKEVAFEQSQGADNLGLSFEKFLGQIEEHGEHILKDKNLEKITGFRFNKSPYLKECYSYAFKQWKSALERQENALCFSVVALSKVILGSGNASSIEVGLNLNKPWGVPYISGSSIKGAIASYLRRTGTMSEESADYVNIFGGAYNNEKYSGSVVFNDAWLYFDTDSWFVKDIINPHYQKYYNGDGMPNGMDSPVPVKTLALDSGLSFFVSMQGPRELLEYLKNVMEKAFEEVGIGAKTAVGYGRFKVVSSESERADLVKSIRDPKKVAANIAPPIDKGTESKTKSQGYGNARPQGYGGRPSVVNKSSTYPYSARGIIKQKSKKGKWQVKVDGIENLLTVLNSEAVPAEFKEGDTVKLSVKGLSNAEYTP